MFRTIARAATRVDHQLLFNSISTHFVLTASMAGSVDLTRWSRALLNADIAISAAWPSESAIRVSDRLRKNAWQLRRVRRMKALQKKATASNSIVAILLLSTSSPKLGILQLRANWYQARLIPAFNRFKANQNWLSLARLAISHPVFFVRHIVPSIKITFGDKNHYKDTAGRESSEGNLESLADKRSEDLDDEADVEADQRISALLAEAEEAYLDRQVVSVAIRQRDSDLFSRSSIDGDTYVRLMLRESYHDFQLPDSDEIHHVVFEPRLLLHRSGMAQIDLTISATGGLNVRQALAMSWGGREAFHAIQDGEAASAAYGMDGAGRLLGGGARCE